MLSEAENKEKCWSTFLKNVATFYKKLIKIVDETNVP
jgi:hypothetical protein